MKTRIPSGRMSRLLIGVSCLGLVMLGACNKQAGPTAAPMVAPPVAALPLAAGAPPPAAPAPVAAALPAPPTPVRYAPLPQREDYGNIDQAYSMGQAFADTPPDYAVDYQGTRPWIWRADDGAYQIAEPVPDGERFYYYYPGQDYPFLVRDPDYSYGYDNGELVSVYGPDGVALSDVLAARRADEASRYLYRARELYRAAQYQQRQSAYASAWEGRRDQFRRANMVWQQQQAQNTQWRDWHDAHQAQEQQQWRQERDHRLAYAAAIGVAAAASRGAAPNAAQVAQRQAAYFSNWNERHARGAAPQQQASAPRANPTAAPVARTAPPITAVKGVPPPRQQMAEARNGQVAAAEAKAAQAAQVQKQAAEAQSRNRTAARASAAQAAQAQRLATEAQRREAEAAKVKAAQDARAQKLAAKAKQHEAAAAQAKAARTAQAQKVAAERTQREAAAAQAKAAHAAEAQKAAAEAKQREAAAAQAKAANAAHAQQAAAQAKQREAAAAKAKAELHARQAAAQAKPQKPAAASNGKKPEKDKTRHGRKNGEAAQPQ
jgi:hypothetical protein